MSKLILEPTGCLILRTPILSSRDFAPEPRGIFWPGRNRPRRPRAFGVIVTIVIVLLAGRWFADFFDDAIIGMLAVALFVTISLATASPTSIERLLRACLKRVP